MICRTPYTSVYQLECKMDQSNTLVLIPGREHHELAKIYITRVEDRMGTFDIVPQNGVAFRVVYEAAKQ